MELVEALHSHSLGRARLATSGLFLRPKAPASRATLTDFAPENPPVPRRTFRFLFAFQGIQSQKNGAIDGGTCSLWRVPLILKIRSEYNRETCV